MISIDIDHFRARVLQDALTEVLPDYWRNRAQQFEDAAPKLGEFHGNATSEELRARWRECKTTAQACRNHAELLEAGLPDHITDEVTDVLEEVA